MSKKNKEKFYTVWSGTKVGVFDSWKECELNIKGVTGAQFKSFPTKKLAEEALQGVYEDYKGKESFVSVLSEEQIAKIGKPNLNTISVDAACSGSPGLMEYKGVETKTKFEIFSMGPFEQANNNIGEFLALVHGLAILSQSNDKRPIYSDSRTAISWVKNKKVLSKLKRDKTNEIVFQLVDRALFWLMKNKYENKILKWETKAWGEIPADFGRK